MNTDELLALLRANARTPVADLARELNAGEEQVAAEIARLENEGAIVGYQAIVNPLRLEARVVQAAVEVRITPERGGGFDRLATRIARFDEVVSCYLMSGGYDLLVVVQAETLQGISQFISEKLATIKGVIATATHFRMKAYKENGVVMTKDPERQRLAVTP